MSMDTQHEYAEDNPWTPNDRDDDDPGRLEFDEPVHSIEQAERFLGVWRQHLVARPSSRLAVREIAAWESIKAKAKER